MAKCLSEQVARGLSDERARVSYYSERIAAEIGFAEFLADRHPDRATELEPLIERASAIATSRMRGSEEAARAVAEAEEILAPCADAAKTYEVFCVGHAHIDMNWMWSWPETVAVTVDTVTTMLALLDEYPEFIISQSQASIYRILERYRPDLLARIKEHVASGRWEVTASHWVECEKNIVSGESLCRHLLYTRAYMADLFGLSPEDVPIDWAPDTFGHAETVPSYLTQGGVKYVYLHRPGAHFDQPVPRAFRWTGPDGSTVLVRNDMHLGYNGVIAPDLVDRSLIPMTRELSLPYTMFVYGIGDHGGGPTRRDLERLGDMASWPIFPNMHPTKALDFYRRLEADSATLPERTGELNFEFTGCYTTQTLIKRANRLAEASLPAAEQSAWVAERTAGIETDRTLLENAWEHTLLSHFHDILPGSGVRDTRTYAHGAFQETAAAVQSVRTRALRAVAELVDTRPAAGVEPPHRYHTSTRFGSGVGFGGSETGVTAYEASATGAHPFVLFNTSGCDHAQVAEVVVWDTGSWEEPAPDRFNAVGPDGSRVCAQITETGTYWGHRYVRLCFPASVPAWGYAYYHVEESGATDEPDAREPDTSSAVQTGFSHVCSYAGYERGPEGLENEYLRVEVDPETGAPARIVDRASGVELDTHDAGLEYAIEQPGSMSAWRLQPLISVERPRAKACRRVHRGPYLARIDCDFEVSQSTFTVRYELAAGDPLLRISISGTWFERGDSTVGIPSLRFALPVAPEDPVFTCEEPFGAVEREIGYREEVPAYRWASVHGRFSGGSAACVLYNDTKHGHSYHDGTLYLTLIRSSYSPDPLPEIGEHEMRLAIGIESLEDETALPVHPITLRSELFNTPIVAVQTTQHAGSLPACDRWMSFRPLKDAPLPVVCAIKASEDGEGVIVRCYNPHNREAAALLTCSPRIGTPASCRETDLLERSAGVVASSDGGEVRVTIPARAIRTFRLELREES